MRLRSAWWGAALALCVGGPASAQFGAATDPAARFEWQGFAQAEFRNQFASKSSRGDEFDAWELGIHGEFGGPINESILVGIAGGYRYASYDFNLDNGVPAGFGTTGLPRDPWNSINILDVSPFTTVLIGNQFSLTARVPIRFAAESGADRNGAIAGVSALVRWQPTEALALAAGLGVTSQLEGKAETFPIVSLRYRFSENLRFETEGSLIQGGHARLLWGPAEAIRLSLSAGYERTRFRLDRHGNAPDRNGVGERRSIPVEAGVRFQFQRGAHLEFRGGFAFNNRLRVESRTGARLYDQRFDAAPTLSVALTVPFGLTEPTAPPRPALAGRPTAPPARR